MEVRYNIKRKIESIHNREGVIVDIEIRKYKKTLYIKKYLK